MGSMSRLLFFLALFLSPIALNAVANDKIEHVIVIMFENRSFDHIVGFMKQNDSRIDGCLPDMGKPCSNPMDPQDPNSVWYPVNNQAQEHQISDPDHSFVGTTDQVYGYGPDTQDPPPMSGFIKNYANKEIIMECFPPETVPAMTTLASEFAIFQNWYCSVPGPTEVNRLYLYSATSDGSAANDDARLAYGYPQRSIFENLDSSKYNATWGVYFEEAPTAFFIKYNRHDGNLHKFHAMEDFYTDVAAGTLPNFSFLEPRYFEIPDIPANDQHPDHDVGLGDQLMKSIYEAVRASPKWNETLLLITYDEHGGFFDHVPPPTDCPNPDGKDSHDTTPSFDFTRLGVRVPMIMISPWVKKGMVISEPMETHYEHSSLSSTLLNLFMPDQTFLTKRDAWAQPFDWILGSVTEPRTDCPTTLPTAPTQREYGFLPPMDQLGNRPATELQKSLIKMASGLKTGEVTETGEEMTEAEGAYYMRDTINDFLGREVVKFNVRR